MFVPDYNYISEYAAKFPQYERGVFFAERRECM